jgi:hypothetical protein
MVPTALFTGTIGAGRLGKTLGHEEYAAFEFHAGTGADLCVGSMTRFSPLTSLYKFS